ncbi:MAG: helix-turn-helix transcriptional regulator [Sedimentibacter sp.]
MNTGKIIRDLRIKNKLSSKELSKILNISESAISLYESGKRTPSISLIIKMADYFNVSTDYLLGVTEKKYQFNTESETDLSVIIDNIVCFFENSDYILYDGKIIDKNLAAIFKNFLMGISENMHLLSKM